MSSADTKLHCLKTMFFTQGIVPGLLSWSLLALLHSLVFSGRISNSLLLLKRAEWSVVGTHIFEAIAYLAAGVLCLRNWRSPQIPSGYSVWLVISIAMLLYFQRRDICQLYRNSLARRTYRFPCRSVFCDHLFFSGDGHDAL